MRLVEASLKMRARAGRFLDESRQQLGRFLRTYNLLLIILGVALIASWPGRWPDGSLGQNIASNVFATFLVTPFVVFGVDRALRQAQQRRDVARVGTIRAELKFLVGRMINAVLSPNLDAIPGLLDLMMSQIRTKTMDNVDAIATYVVENDEETRLALSRMEFENYDRGLQNARRSVPELRQTLALAQEAISPEDFAMLWRAARELDQAEQGVVLFRYAVHEKMPWVEGPTGVDSMRRSGEEIATLVIRLSEWFVRFEIPD